MSSVEQKISLLLISCYELGHQPAGIAMPMGFLTRAGFVAEALDISVAGFPRVRAKQADFIGISVPMHTALRIGLRVAQELRQLNPTAHICFYGLYATLNADYLLDNVADSIIGGEYENALLALISALNNGVKNDEIMLAGVKTRQHRNGLPIMTRLDFPLPVRDRLLPMQSYARLEYQGEQRLVGYLEASRGCRYHCTHCPIPSVYQGKFFVVPRDTVLADIRALVKQGARHITFGDPDFLNGPNHALRITQALHAEFPELTYDFTAKIEHLLKHQQLLPEFRELGCLFIVSAVESLSDEVLTRLAKNHTKNDIYQAFEITRQAGITLRPSFVAFTPWTTLDDYIELLEFVARAQLIDQVDPIQFAIRLLVPPGSLLLNDPDSRRWLGQLIEASFSYQWQHPDARMDRLHQQVNWLVEHNTRKQTDARETFTEICALAYQMRGDDQTKRAADEQIALATMAAQRARPPRLTEAWFC